MGQYLVLRAAVAGCLLFRSAAILRGLRGGPPCHAEVRAARLLALRDLGQGLFIALRPSRASLEAGAAVDAAHLASMAALAALSPRHRRAATGAAVLAAAELLLGLRAAGRCR